MEGVSYDIGIGRLVTMVEERFGRLAENLYLLVVVLGISSACIYAFGTLIVMPTVGTIRLTYHRFGVATDMPAHEIEITPEMIEARICALADYGPEGDSAERVVVNIFLAMLEARARHITVLKHPSRPRAHEGDEVY